MWRLALRIREIFIIIIGYYEIPRYYCIGWTRGAFSADHISSSIVWLTDWVIRVFGVFTTLNSYEGNYEPKKNNCLYHDYEVSFFEWWRVFLTVSFFFKFEVFIFIWLGYLSSHSLIINPWSVHAGNNILCLTLIVTAAYYWCLSWVLKVLSWCWLGNGNRFSFTHE